MLYNIFLVIALTSTNYENGDLTFVKTQLQQKASAQIMATAKTKTVTVKIRVIIWCRDDRRLKFILPSSCKNTGLRLEKQEFKLLILFSTVLFVSQQSQQSHGIEHTD